MMRTEKKTKCNMRSLIVILLSILGLVYVSYAPFQVADMNWLATLTLPPFAPPLWLANIAWPCLYVLMALALWCVWLKRDHPSAKTAFTVFTIQFLVSLLWGPVVVNTQSPLLAVLYADTFLFLLVATLATFWRLSKPAGLLLIPGILWILFFACVRTWIWFHNT